MMGEAPISDSSYSGEMGRGGGGGDIDADAMEKGLRSDDRNSPILDAVAPLTPLSQWLCSNAPGLYQMRAAEQGQRRPYSAQVDA